MKKIFLTVIVVLLAVTTVSAQYKGDWREEMNGNNNDSSERPEEDALPY